VLLKTYSIRKKLEEVKENSNVFVIARYK